MKKSLILLLTLLCSASTWAAATPPPKPDKCPAVTNITQNKFALAQQATDGTYGALMLNKFDTQALWGFVVAEIPASSLQDALSKAKSSLETLNFKTGPMYLSSNNLWGCIYTVDAGYPVLALTPLPS